VCKKDNVVIKQKDRGGFACTNGKNFLVSKCYCINYLRLILINKLKEKEKHMKGKPDMGQRQRSWSGVGCHKGIKHVCIQMNNDTIL
jgi:hypothetical protein